MCWCGDDKDLVLKDKFRSWPKEEFGMADLNRLYRKSLELRESNGGLSRERKFKREEVRRQLIKL